jgi:hypothetical protein
VITEVDETEVRRALDALRAALHVLRAMETELGEPLP